MPVAFLLYVDGRRALFAVLGLVTGCAEPEFEQLYASSCEAIGDDGLERCSIPFADDARPAVDERSYLIYRPPVIDGEKRLVVALHGLVSGAQSALSYMELRPLADEHGFSILLPEGEGWPLHWNAGDCCAVPGQPNLDDVGFVLAAIDDVADEETVVYVMGFSNGGMLAHRLLCEHPERFAAGAAVSGTLATADCSPQRPVPVLLLHGSEDAILSIDGSPGLGSQSLSETADVWRRRNGCNDHFRHVESDGEITCTIDPYCVERSEVHSCTVEGGGHSWPGAGQSFATGYSTADFSSADIWAFLSRFPAES